MDTPIYYMVVDLLARDPSTKTKADTLAQFIWAKPSAGPVRKRKPRETKDV